MIVLGSVWLGLLIVELTHGAGPVLQSLVARCAGAGSAT